MVTKMSVANVKTEFKFSFLLIYASIPPLVSGFHGISFQDPDLVTFC